tara:strand:+ start:197 stop:1054 length:858 start_codon:yes stop_codon:yes gene_type:complete
MSTLEEKSIATIRASLLKADSAKLCDAWKNASIVKGGNENGVFGDIMSRDVIAYTILRILFLLKHKVFGGFLRAHYSGKPWTDIDIMVNMTQERGSVDTLLPALVRNIIQFITFVLPIPKCCIAYVLHSGNKYGHACDLKINVADKVIVIIKLDMVVADFQNPITQIPVTVGSALEMLPDGSVRRRESNMMIARRLAHWNPEEIIDMLRDGKDVKLCLKAAPKTDVRRLQYQNYYWCRIAKMTSLNWSFIAIDGLEPSPLSEEELQKALRCYTQQKVKDASRVWG